MGAFRRTLATCAVAGFLSAAGCHAPEPFDGPGDRLRTLPPAVARGAGAPPVEPTDSPRPITRATVLPRPRVPEWVAQAQPVPTPSVTPIRADLPPPRVEASVVPPPAPETEWRPVGAAEPLRPPVVVPEPGRE